MRKADNLVSYINEEKCRLKLQWGKEFPIKDWWFLEQDEEPVIKDMCCKKCHSVTDTWVGMIDENYMHTERKEYRCSTHKLYYYYFKK